MIKRATAKANSADLKAIFSVGDIGQPSWEHGSFDVVFSRHVVWTLPEPDLALRRWTELLVPGGRLILVEGRWGTSSGLAAAELRVLVPDSLHDVQVVPLPHRALWGKEIVDERYALSARR